MKKLVYTAGKYCVFLVCIFVLVIVLFECTVWRLAGDPVNTLYSESFSPDGRHKAVVYERNSGATTGFSTHVAIVDKNHGLPDSVGNVFILSDHPRWAKVSVKWDGNGVLVISYSSDEKISLQVRKCCGVSVTYESGME